MFKKGSTEETMIFHYEIPEKTLFVLTTQIAYVILLTSAIFWQTLIRSEEDCSRASTDTRLICFVGGVFTDCSSLEGLIENNTNTSVGCYTIPFAVGNAFTTSVGCFSSSIFFISFYIFLMLAISRGKDGSKKRKYVAAVTMVIIWLCSLAAPIALAIPGYNDYLYQFMSITNYLFYSMCVVQMTVSVYNIQWRDIKKTSEHDVINAPSNYNAI